MSKRSPLVDAYIKEAPDYARPILRKLRTLFHKASPEMEEHIKWGAPSFEHKGIVVGMVAFKNHVGYGFKKAPLLKDPAGLFEPGAGTSFCMLKAASVAELPADEILVSYTREAVALNKEGRKVPAPNGGTAAPALLPPPILLAALKQSRRAQSHFDSFSPSNRKDYIEWITTAKRDETRAQRVATAIEWIAEGKPRNWKYMKSW
jgi:hypothetical protein